MTRGRCRARPVLHQISSVDGADTRGEVPANLSTEGGLERTVRCGKHARKSGRRVAIVGTCAVHIHVALCDVIENAGASDGVSIGRIARAVAAGTVFARGEFVIDRIGISLPSARTLINESLDTRENRRGERSSTRTGPAARVATADGSAITEVRKAKNIVVTPNAVGREERNVGKVAHAIVRVAHHGLPRGLCPSLAASADNTIYRRRARRATAGRATGSCRGLKMLLTGRAIAEASASVCRRVPFKLGNQRTAAGIIPGNLRNVRTRRGKCRGVRRIPIRAVGSCKGVAEIRSTYSYVIRTGSERIGADAMRSGGDAVVAHGRSAVP